MATDATHHICLVGSVGFCRAEIHCISSADLALPKYTELIQSFLILTVFFVAIFDFAPRRILQHPVIGAQCDCDDKRKSKLLNATHVFANIL